MKPTDCKVLCFPRRSKGTSRRRSPSEPSTFVSALDLATLGFEGIEPEAPGRPSYHPAAMLKIYLFGYLNRVQSMRRLEQEAHRNLELMWLVRRLAPDFKTLADFRAENTVAIKNVCREFIVLCRRWKPAKLP
jgi:transposase